MTILARKPKPDTGVVGLGKMRIKQITETDHEEKQDEFDLMEDLLIFMRNEPVFYRKKYYPMIMQMRSCAKKQTQFDKNRSILPIVKSAYGEYCKKYRINPKNHQYTKTNVRGLLNRIYTEEMQNINRGEYD